MRHLETAKEKAPYDVIIVPGVPFEDSTWSSTMKIRVNWSYYLHQNGITKNIIYSGNAVYTPYSEAKIMREYGLALGLPNDQLFLDTLAEHTVENIYYSYRVAKKAGFKKIAFATDPFQAKSMRRFIKTHDFGIDLIPIVFDTLSARNYIEPKIDPSIAFDSSFISIKDRESFSTRFSGTMGKQIIWYKSDLKDDKLIRKYRRKERLIE